MGRTSVTLDAGALFDRLGHLCCGEGLAVHGLLLVRKPDDIGKLADLDRALLGCLEALVPGSDRHRLQRGGEGDALARPMLSPLRWIAVLPDPPAGGVDHLLGGHVRTAGVSVQVI